MGRCDSFSGFATLPVMNKAVAVTTTAVRPSLNAGQWDGAGVQPTGGGVGAGGAGGGGKVDVVIAGVLPEPP